jgi:hypothetical protein
VVNKALGAVGKLNGKDIYSTIGVRSLINGRGTWTYLSGSLELPEVRAAKQAAAPSRIGFRKTLAFEQRPIGARRPRAEANGKGRRRRHRRLCRVAIA